MKAPNKLWQIWPFVYVSNPNPWILWHTSHLTHHCDHIALHQQFEWETCSSEQLQGWQKTVEHLNPQMTGDECNALMESLSFNKRYGDNKTWTSQILVNSYSHTSFGTPFYLLPFLQNSWPLREQMVSQFIFNQKHLTWMQTEIKWKVKKKGLSRV